MRYRSSRLASGRASGSACCRRTAHADDLADARKAMQKGDLRAAQIDLRNAVRSDPQNAEAHYWLGQGEP